LAHKQKDSPEYWEKRLRKEGLSMERGRSKRVSYVGGTAILDALHGAQAMGTRPKGGDLDISYKKGDENGEITN
jgi:hypothetical protein